MGRFDLETSLGQALDDLPAVGEEMYQLVAELFPICRSITGDGVRQTLKVIQRHIPIKIFEVPTGTKVFDWTVPREWNIHDAYVLDPTGKKIIDFNENNLHIVSYSVPVDKTISLEVLQEHLYSLEAQPKAIPYVTSYYEDRWGFCLSHNQRMQLKKGMYRVVVDSELKQGSLAYGELIIPGATKQEIFLSTYVCHPSMANNELSGPAVTTFLAKWTAGAPRRYTYRIIFIPETIGSITYLSRHLDHLKNNVVAGFNITCVGDERAYSFLPSRAGNTLADRAALCILKHRHLDFIHYSYLDRGSDERQYCSPGVDLPVVSVMRSKYRKYPEYHTSLDNLNLVTPAGLAGSFAVVRDCIDLLENNRFYSVTCKGEPQLSRRGLFPTLGTRDLNRKVRETLDFMAYADGNKDLIDISNTIQVPPWRLYTTVRALVAEGLLVPQEKPV